MIQRTALLRMLAALRVFAGLVRGATGARLPRHLHLAILRVLRPAESAALRLVIVAAREMPVPTLAERRASVMKGTAKKSSPRLPGFSIVDRPWHLGPPRPRYAPGIGPRITFIGGDNPVYPEDVPKAPDDLVDAAKLSHRLETLEGVLNDLPRYALRLSRWYAKQSQGLARPSARRPVRPGRPPGHRKRHTHEVDEVLSECHILALRALLRRESS